MTFRDLLPEQQTRMFDQASEDGLRNTPPGMAHWSGTGPKDRCCRECNFYSFEGRYAANSKKHPANGLKPGRCAKYTQMMKKPGAKFPWHKASCKYFEPHPSPPVAVER